MRLLKKANWFLIILPLLIFSLGGVTLFSTSPNLISNQMQFFFVGLIVFIVVSLIDYELLKPVWKHIYVVILVLLILLFVFGQTLFGSTRWFEIGSFTFQPSEFAKVGVIITLATLLSMNKSSVHSFKYLLKVLALIAPLFIFVFLQPDLGTSLIILAITAGVLWFAGLNKSYYLIGLVVLGVFSAPLWNILKDYQKERILVFLNPSLDILGSGYNVIQSTIAVGSGGFLGRGFGHGTQSHLQFLPVHWTDFIFAAFAEEWGFIGVIGLLFMYFGLLWLILNVALKVKSTYGSLICIGVFIVFFLQFTINVGMNMGIMPVTGIPLPLVSYGGSSLVSSMIMLGLVNSVWIHRKV
jgi:rod shape determining protein RodA